MKILFFIESLRSGGKERRLVELIKGLKKYPDIECKLVLTRKDIHYKDIFSTGTKIHYIVRKHFKKDLRLFFLFFKIAKNYKPDIIHAWCNMAAIYALPVKILFNIPLINSSITHSSPLKTFSKSWLYLKLTIPFTDIVISNSRAGLVAHKLKENSKNLIIHNGFNFDRIKDLSSKSEIRKKINVTTKYIVAMVASFSSYKDYSTYIKAANKVLNNNKNITFLCIGSGNNVSYKKMVKSMYRDNVRFLGIQDNVESIMNICDIGVLSTYTEGISNSIMEFMALGKPVITTYNAGTKELLVDGESGIFVKSKSVDQLSSQIIYLLKDQKLALKLGMNAKQRIQKWFNLEKMVICYKKIYQNLINTL